MSSNHPVRTVLTNPRRSDHQSKLSYICKKVRYVTRRISTLCGLPAVIQDAMWELGRSRYEKHVAFQRFGREGISELYGLDQYVLLVICRGSVMRESPPSSTLVMPLIAYSTEKMMICICRSVIKPVHAHFAVISYPAII